MPNEEKSKFGVFLLTIQTLNVKMKMIFKLGGGKMNNRYNTLQRKSIYDYLMLSKDTFVSVEDILTYLKGNGKHIGTTTIYRYLNYLENNNELRVEIKNHMKYYQLGTKKDNINLFLKCKKCGKFMNFDCREFENINKHIKNKHGFNLDLNTIIYGTCNICT